MLESWWLGVLREFWACQVGPSWLLDETLNSNNFDPYIHTRAPNCPTSNVVERLVLSVFRRSSPILRVKSHLGKKHTGLTQSIDLVVER